jgi:glucuronoarabinoxylan endo-1,4-beta-xylanase
MTNVTKTTLTSANPNCLFIANADKLSNTKNVIVDGVCANLELTDAKPFKAPAAFTATAAKFTKTVSDAGFATMVIPFNAAIPQGVQAFNLKGVNGETIAKSDALQSITKDQAVLIKADEGTYDFTKTNVEIAATADGVLSSYQMKGAYSTTTAAVDAGNYVLQKNGNDVNFYLVTGTPATVPPFRAYLNVPAKAARTLYLDFNNATSIEAVQPNEEPAEAEVYNLAGQRVDQPTKGLYIVNGKKVIK